MERSTQPGPGGHALAMRMNPGGEQDAEGATLRADPQRGAGEAGVTVTFMPARHAGRREHPAEPPAFAFSRLSMQALAVPLQFGSTEPRVAVQPRPAVQGQV